MAVGERQDTVGDRTEALMSRQHGIIHRKVAELRILVAGLGMGGSWITQALARMGPAHLEGWDFDLVEQVNLGSQAYNDLHVGIHKAQAVAGLLSGFEFTRVVGKFPEQAGRSHRYDVVVSCVDTMEGRRDIAKWCMKHKVPLFIDCRAIGETSAVLAVTDQAGYEDYLEKLPPDEAVPPVPCGQRGTAYVGMWEAARVACTINNWCRGVPSPRLLVWQVGANRQMGGDE